MLRDYLRWKELNPEAELFADITALESDNDTHQALRCPFTGGVMTKYRISKENDHHLDLSPKINAVWMDRGEWELLKSEGLAGKLNNIFTDHWQRQIRADESAEMLRVLYERRFGDFYADIKAFRAKLDNREDRSEIIAYLLAEDPYTP